MGANFDFLRSAEVVAWIGQFESADQPAACELLAAMRLVSRDEFSEGLRQLLRDSLTNGQLPVGVYVERELVRRNTKPSALFKQSKGKVKRAFGPGPKLVQPTRPFSQVVGSEGLVAQIVSEFFREAHDQCLLSPGPDAIRSHRVRRFVLVTDFIGTGRRVMDYLDAAWRVRSVRSWWSARKSCGMSFEVIAYSATEAGRALVESHSLPAQRPRADGVSYHRQCLR